MSSDSFESSTLGPKALEARLKAEAERKQRAADQAARERAAIAKRESWKAFQNEVSSEYDQALSGRKNPEQFALNRTGSLAPHSGKPGNSATTAQTGKLKRF